MIAAAALKSAYRLGERERPKTRNGRRTGGDEEVNGRVGGMKGMENTGERTTDETAPEGCAKQKNLIIIA